MSTQITTQQEQQISELFTTGFELQQKLQAAQGPLKSMHTALGMVRLREMLLTHRAIDAIRPLVNTKAGFRCDRKDYTNEQIADFVVDCLLHGDQLCGNHVNLIAGSRFVTKEGWDYKLREAGATRVRVVSYLPDDISTDKGDRSVRCIGRVAVSCSCAVGKQEFTLEFRNEGAGKDSRFEVDGRGVDAAAAVTQMRGKAEARALARLFQYATGITDAGDEEPIDEEASALTILPEATQAIEQRPRRDIEALKAEMTAIGRTLPDDAKAGFRDAYGVITKGTPDALLAAEPDILQMVSMLPITDDQRETIRTAIALRRAGVT